MTGKYITLTLILVGLILNFSCFERLGENRRDEARIEINTIHDRIRTGEFGKIYDDASPRVKECYSRDSFSEKMELLVHSLYTEDPELKFEELVSETKKFDAISSRSDMFTEGVYTVGNVANNLREYITLRNEEGKLKLFSYRVFEVTKRSEIDVPLTMIACPESK